ncbi:hypothetical protein EX895_000955 [Sporisorium graminicola]|uniref:Elongator complex protein 4 n=1 Tax=Sporisorium graminicola TaxID=280036 RepID=A0A4U7L2I5_9BASI|nr:hypothetical protein EX895_000955 [Sporisorium graminicola]TKY90957.1 hypothetical protein EX895_000955 [Sporisorium graminicola]
MSSFKRRVNPSSGSSTPAPLPAGVKPSSFSSPVPLISTGVPALDDLLSGGGLSSSSDLLILPATGTAAQSAAQIGASSSTAATLAETDHAARAAAEPYVELLLGYSVAQGIASDHVGVVIGEDVRGLVGGLMARAGNLDEQLLERIGSKSAIVEQDPAQAGPSDLLSTVGDEDDNDGSESKGPEGAATVEEQKTGDAQREREMKIAWRYSNMKQFNTTVNEPSSPNSSTEPTPFCHTFDLSKRIDGRIIQHAVDQGKLEMVDISTATHAAGASGSNAYGSNAYEVAYKHIEAAAQRCRHHAASAPVSAPPVLRVAIRALGSPAWTVARGQSRHTETIRFLHRLKRLLRSLSLVDHSATASARAVTIPSMAVLSVSSFLLSQPSTPRGGGGGSTSNLAHRMVHSVDSAISMSAFASSSALRSAFSAYTGALKVLKTPAVGTLTNPSIRASVLRGMGTGAGSGAGGKSATSGSAGGGGEGGAGGGENNLAFKVRRKRLVIETLHLDVEGGVSERRTKPPKNSEEVTGTKDAAQSGAAKTSSTGASTFVRRQPAAAVQGISSAAETTSGTAAPKKFAGLSALRQRGLAAAAAAATSSTSGTTGGQNKEYAVEVDSASHTAHHHPHPAKRTPHTAQSRVANTRAEDLEF